MKQVLYYDLDLHKALKVVNWIERGDIKIEIVDGPTPLANNYIMYTREALEPVSPEKRIILRLMSYKVNLMASKVTLVCLNCFNYLEEMPVSDVESEFNCPYCGSDFIAIENKSIDEVSKILDKCTPENIRLKCRRLYSLALLYRKYGYKVAYAVASGLPIRNIKKILSEDLSLEMLIRKLWEESRRLLKERYLGSKALHKGK